MTIGEIYDSMTDQLKAVYDEREAASITGLVLETRLGIRRIDRILRKTEALDPALEAGLRSDLHALLQNEPVQYVLGEAWFDGLLLKVNGHVLIPRPETEELVHWVADDVKMASDMKTRTKAPSDQNTAITGQTEIITGPPAVITGPPAPSILDIGTGSGCIPIALQKHLPGALITGLDISPEALLLARENADRHQMPVLFLKADILDDATWSDLPSYDIIVSNPPYIAQSEKDGMHSRVLGYEPHLALFVPDNDPLLFYRKIARFAGVRLCAGGALYLEINEALGRETTDLLEQEGFKQIILRKDLQGKDRMIRATR
jgi:release factor glutamine methyltransferase